MDVEEIARWAFTIFVILAFFIGTANAYMKEAGTANASSAEAYVTLILLILGAVVGVVSITSREVMPFLIAAIALVVTGNATIWGSLQLIHPMLRTWVITTLNLIGAFAAPAAVINAVKAVLAMTRDK
jgi:hypothetical protein